MKAMRNKGFTLIELLIVIAISTLLSSAAILYNRTAQNSVNLSVESAKLAEMVLRAKQLAIATYAKGSVCGYGVSIDYAAGRYSLFSYDPVSPGTSCPVATTTFGISASMMSAYASSSWDIPVATGVKLVNAGANVVKDVLFYPPDPVTFISFDGSSLQENVTGHIYLVPVGTNSTATISINPAGQVQF